MLGLDGGDWISLGVTGMAVTSFAAYEVRRCRKRRPWIRQTTAELSDLESRVENVLDYVVDEYTDGQLARQRSLPGMHPYLRAVKDR